MQIAGAKLDRYESTRIGAGGMGEVDLWAQAGEADKPSNACDATNTARTHLVRYQQNLTFQDRLKLKPHDHVRL
jgi:hypothetical protein